MPDMKFDNSYADTLLRLAEVDLSTAAMFIKGDKNHAQTCFLSRQVVEACLKVALIRSGERLPPINDIRVLLAKLPLSETTLPFGSELFFLELYSAASASADGIDAARTDAEAAYEKAEHLLTWVREAKTSESQQSKCSEDVDAEAAPASPDEADLRH